MMKIRKNSIITAIIAALSLFSTSMFAAKVDIKKPFLCPDVSPLTQRVTEKGDLLIGEQVFRLHRANTAGPVAQMVSTVWRSEDDTTEVRITQYDDGTFTQDYFVFTDKINGLLSSEDDIDKYITLSKDSYTNGGRGCCNK